MYGGTEPRWHSEKLKCRSAVRSALDLCHVEVVVSYTDCTGQINQYINSTWQDDWNGAVANKLHPVKSVLAVLLQAVQEGLSCLVSLLHRSHIFGPFMYLKKCILKVGHILFECNHFSNKNIYI